MKVAHSIDEARNWYAEDLRVASPVIHNLAIIDAFAKVPREQYLGKGPWRIQPRFLDRSTYTSSTADPHHIYHDVLVSIDSNRKLNNGQPSLWAFNFDQLGIVCGGTILQVGAGVGYFTAVLAELVTSTGRVIAYEVDENLAKRAEENLKEYPNVTVISGDATEARELPEFDSIIVFAGATHVPESWFSALSPFGRIAIPFTAEDGWGFMLLLENRDGSFAASSLGSCGFYHCSGARNPKEASALKSALETAGRDMPTLGQLHRGRPQDGDQKVWYVGDGFWLSRA